MNVLLPTYPLFETSVMAADQALLDELAARYVASLGGAEPEMQRFLFGEVPVTVFDRVFDDRATDGAPGLMWLMQLSGYFGGRWLRGEIAAAQPDAPLVSFSVAPTQDAFQATAARAEVAVRAAAADHETVLAYARSSLFDEVPADGNGMPVPGLTDSFGYNLGYMLEILAAPPEGLRPGPQHHIEASGLFGCEYASTRLAVLRRLAPIQSALAAGADPYASLVGELLPIQEAAVPRGRSVWSSGLSVQGFPQSEYDQLLDVSGSFLETVQATAITMAHATATGDVPDARRGAIANAAMVVWLGAYRDGLLDGSGDIVLPSFT